jgi:hypothetical protein
MNHNTVTSVTSLICFMQQYVFVLNKLMQYKSCSNSAHVTVDNKVMRYDSCSNSEVLLLITK